MTDFQKIETLDPDDWGAFRKLSHKILDDMLDHTENIRTHPMTRQPEDKLNKLLVPLSAAGEGEEKVYNELMKNQFNYDVYNSRPQFWGWVGGAGSPYASIIDMIISTRNAGTEIMNDYPLWTQSMKWIKELLEIPQRYSGVYVAGGSEANYTGLAVARNSKSTTDMKKKGMQGVDKKMVLYGSNEMHHCIERSIELLGLGNEALRWIPVDETYKIDLDALQKQINEDKEKGLHPFCVIGNAGTVNTGAFDDLNSLANLCEAESLWLHVDGAFGSWIRISDSHKHLADGLDRADSIAVDLHKWMNMPYGIGLTLVKDKLAHYKTFVYGRDAEYLDSLYNDADLEMMTLLSSLALSRRNLGLKSYMLLRAYGRNKYRNLVQKNVDGIAYFKDLIEKTPYLEVTAPLVSNIVCFRYNPGGLSDDDIESLNKSVLEELWKKVFGMVSDTTLNGVYMLRACSVNHRTRKEDYDWLLQEILDTAAKVNEV